MMRFLFYFGIGCFIIHVPKEGQCVVIVANGNGTSIECSSNAEITFKFISPVQGASFAIAECDEIIKSCRLLVKDVENTYNITYTGRGGILKINHMNKDTYGTYQCCETYFPRNYVTVDIIPRYINGGDTHITHYEGKEKTEINRPLIIVPIIAVTIICVGTFVIVYIFRRRIVNRMPRYPEPEGAEQHGMISSAATASLFQQEPESQVGALQKVMEHTLNALHDLCSTRESISWGDSHQTHANIEAAVKKIEKQFKIVTEELKTVREARVAKDATSLKRRHFSDDKTRRYSK